MENHYEVDLPIGVAVVAMELARELGHVFIEAKTHGTEVITITTSNALIQHEDAPIPQIHRSMSTRSTIGGNIFGGVLKEANGLKAMGSSVFVIEDPFGMGFAKYPNARRWWKKHDLDILGKELDGTLCS